MRRVAKGKGVGRINALVDIGNAVSIARGLPLGVHVMGSPASVLELRMSREGDVFVPLGADEADPTLTPGELVYAEGGLVQTRRWTWRQSENGKTGPDATSALIPIDGFTGSNLDAVLAARDELAGLIEEAFGCRVPQSVNLTFTEGAFVFLVPVTLFLAPGALASGDFASFVTNFAFYAVFSAIISTALAKIMFAASGMMLASTALGRIRPIMSAPVLDVAVNPEAPQGNRVEFKDVSFTYDGAADPALNHVSFTVEPGQTVALVGPSGGGKTTAASLIPRFWDVTSGAVEVGGVDVRRIDPHVLMDQIAFVFQNNRLFKTSILENVRAARPEATREEVEAALAAAQCDDIIAKLPGGIDTMIGTEGTYLSGGEQQRVALARAILKDAPIVVLDEATASLDVENETKVQGALSRLLAGKTVLVIAHRMRTVENADKIVVLSEGSIVEEGSPAELLEREGSVFARMHALQSASAQWSL